MYGDIDENQKSLIVALIDKSGSMADVASDTIGGYNAFIDTVRKEGKNAYVSTLFFGSGRHGYIHWRYETTRQESITKKVRDAQPIESVKPIDMTEYVVSGGTPLYDAIADAIIEAERVAAEKMCSKVTLLILTDGEENSSTLFSHAAVKSLIEAKTTLGWQVIFLGADLSNARATGVGLGISPLNAMAYNKTSTQTMFSAMAIGTQAYRSSGDATINLSAEQKAAFGDRG